MDSFPDKGYNILKIQYLQNSKKKKKLNSFCTGVTVIT